MPSAKEITTWYEQLKNQRVNFDTIGQEIIDHAMPSKRDITTRRTPGEKKTALIFDATMQDAIPFAADFIHSSILNQGTQWFGLKPKDADIDDDPDVAEQLAQARNQELQTLAQSNYYSASQEQITDWIGFGTAAKLIEAVPQKRKRLSKVMYTPLAYGSYVLAEGEDNMIDTCIRQLDVKAREVKNRWGDKTPEWIAKLAEKEPFRDVCIIHAIFPREVQPRRLELVNPKRMPWASYWIDYERKQVIDESGYHEFPVSVMRMNVIAGEVYGRGWGEIGLPFQKVLNMAMQKGLVEWDKSIDPPMKQLRNSVIGNISHRPGKNTIVTRMDGLEIMDKELRAGNRLHEFNVEDTRRQIREIFHIEQIRAFIANESPNPQKTAFEVERRFRLLYQMLGPTGGRLTSEGLKTDVEVTLRIMARMGLVDAAEEDLDRLDVKFLGPLAKAQRIEEMQSMQEAFADTLAISQVYPDVTDLIDFDKLGRDAWSIREIQHYLRSKEDVLEIRGKKAEVAAQQAEFAAAGAIAEGISKVGPGVKALSDAQGQRQAA